jgi:16S rRNA (adenine1518-N6/adenine1519-N6)-dimethyltransferase
MAHSFKKQFGQNFLRGDRYAQILVDALELTEKDTVVEIGPGDGRVTNLLLATGAKVVAVEVDYDLIPNLVKRFGQHPNFKLLHQDIMKLDPKSLNATSFKMAGSLPYNISKLIIMKFLTNMPKPEKMSFIVQEEVAQDYVVQAPQASFLSNWVRLHGSIKKLETIPASQFHPQPKVSGGILVITPHDLTAAESKERVKMGKFMQLAYRSPRKTLWNNLVAANRWHREELESAWQKLDFAPTVRPAELEFVQWVALVKALNI